MSNIVKQVQIVFSNLLYRIDYEEYYGEIKDNIIKCVDLQTLDVEEFDNFSIEKLQTLTSTLFNNRMAFPINVRMINDESRSQPAYVGLRNAMLNKNQNDHKNSYEQKVFINENNETSDNKIQEIEHRLKKIEDILNVNR